MPDIFLVMARRWSLMLLLTLAGTAAACIASLLSPKLYLGRTTALPANTALNDKSRFFNPNIESLYPELGSSDDLDKIEGTARLDTVFLAVAYANHLPEHYRFDTSAKDALEQAAVRLRKSSDIRKTGYGELNVKVWDKDNEMAATLANALLQTINAIHERLQTEHNKAVLQKLKEAYLQKVDETGSAENKVLAFESATKDYPAAGSLKTNDSAPNGKRFMEMSLQVTEGRKQLQEYLRLINEYELAVTITPNVLLVVERARPLPWYDRPKTAQNVTLAFLASLLFSFLLALFVESRKANA